VRQLIHFVCELQSRIFWPIKFDEKMTSESGSPVKEAASPSPKVEDTLKTPIIGSTAENETRVEIKRPDEGIDSKKDDGFRLKAVTYIKIA